MRIYCYIVLLLISHTLIAQNEAIRWYFANHCGLNFNSGAPQVLHDSPINTIFGNATISDSLGDLLFYTADGRVYNKNHVIMQNGSDLQWPGVYGRAIVKWPGQNDLYFILNARHPQIYLGFYYSLVDMSLDSGLGAITEKNIAVSSGSDAAGRIALVRKAHSDAVWVITRKFSEDALAAYLIDYNGFNPNPILSPMPDRSPSIVSWGPLKVSYDSKYILSSYSNHKNIEISQFNSITGSANYLYTISDPGGVPFTLAGMEYSPDSKYLYVSYNKPGEINCIYQFDMHYIEDETAFNSSAVYLGDGPAMGMQLARDGKIYCMSENNNYIGIIHQPWEKGADCNYQASAIDMSPGDGSFSFPNILLDYLYRFEWEGDWCQFSPITFIPNFIPTPDSIRWFFDEFAPGSVSYELSPIYSFQNPGIHEVQVDVWYPSGRFEHTSREIEIFPTPQPDLGTDTVVCPGSSVTLNANCTADLYSWSTGQFGSPSITVSDSGIYWVSASFQETGCQGHDTIHVGFFPETELDTTAVIITPTACGGATGSITGLYALGPMPLAYQWLDLSGNPFGNNIDATGLPAGQYFLTITDGNGCETTSATYSITDAGNLQVTQIQSAQPHCFRADGQLIISAFSPSGSEMEYSINDGLNYQPDSIFEDLPPGEYIVRIQDINGCEGFYDGNPVILDDIPGPQVTQTTVTNETDGQQNGAIEITATGSTPVLLFSIDNGNNWQSNNGTFNDLSAGTYLCVVKDENDCDTSFTVEVLNEVLTWLQAVTGPGDHCLGNSATVPIEVSNFNNVAAFELKLSYNASSLQCDGYANVIPELSANFNGTVNQAAGEITLMWQDAVPVTLLNQQAIAELVFTPLQAGPGLLDWYTGPTGSAFTNTAGDTIPAQFSAGQVTIYEPPMIISPATDIKTVCMGDYVSFISIAWGNQGPFTYLWTWPDGHSSENDPAFWSVTEADAGDYTLLATDLMGCTDQKTITLIVSDNPVAAFHGSDTLVVDPGYILEAGSGQAHYLWNNGDSTESIEIYSEGMYSVEMESQAGCFGNDSVYIVLREEPPFEPSQYFYIPNAFMPDGDGRNDVFRPIPSVSTISHFSMRVFDRWGGQVFETENIGQGWDGTKNGKHCPEGAYVYRITFQVEGFPGVEGEKTIVGTVVIVR